MTAKDILDNVFRDTGTTQAEAAEKIGMTPKQLSDRMVRDTLKVGTFIKILEAVGVDAKFIVKATGKEIRVGRKGYGDRVRCMVDRVTYDTLYSDALSNDFFDDGVNEFKDGKASELYQDKLGRYFIAEYYNFEGAKNRITPVTKEYAEEFIKTHGEDLKTDRKNCE